MNPLVIWRQFVRLLSTPSTCAQFAPGSDGFAIDALTGLISGTPTAPGTYTVTVAASGGIGVFHAGVEQKWWKGPSACSATDFGSGDFLTNVMAAPVVQCDQIAWSLAGISMAGYNGIISLTIAGVAVWLIRKD